MRRRLIPWRPKPFTHEPNHGRYAVLARVSPGYSPPEGRSPTCYSPVRRSLPKQCARLACVKLAASVRSEPGSNSPVQSLYSIFASTCRYHHPRAVKPTVTHGIDGLVRTFRFSPPIPSIWISMTDRPMPAPGIEPLSSGQPWKRWRPVALPRLATAEPIILKTPIWACQEGEDAFPRASQPPSPVPLRCR
jgi:hypothetical protein